MTQRSDRPVVGRRPAVDALLSALEAAANGPHAVLLPGGPGSGRRTAVRRFLDAAHDAGRKLAAVRLHSLPEDDGIRSLLRFYGSFVTALSRSEAFDEDPADTLDAAAESASDERVTAWLAGLATSVRELRTHAGSANYQIKLPRDNPWLALLHGFDVVGPRAAWVFDLHDIGGAVSPSLWVFLTALLGRARARNWRTLWVAAPGENLYSEKPGDGQPGPAQFLHALFPKAQVIDLPALSAADVGELLADTYRPNSFPEGLAERLATLSKGHPDRLHEVLDALEEDETITWDSKGYGLSSLDDVDLDVLVPMAVEEHEEEEDQAAGGEGDGEDEGDGDGGEEDPSESVREQILHVAALEGREFTAALVRSYLQLGEDEVDDALDDMPQLVKEGEYHKELGTWTYKFRHGFYRDWWKNNAPEGWKHKPQDVARALGTIAMQSYAPAAFEYVPAAARLFTEAGEARGARTLLALAMGSDRAELIEFALETADRFADSPWPQGLVRLLYSASADRMVNGGSPDGARAAVDRAHAWAETNQDAELLAYCKLLDCRIALRKGAYADARKEGETALAGFRALNDTTRAGETLNQLAMIALNMGDPKGADEYLKSAEKASTIPPVKAHSLYIRALLAKRRGNVAQALEGFTRSTELSTQAGNLVLALESMLNQGECALVAGKGKDMAPMLERALEMSRALRSTQRERIAARLLCQAEAGRGRPQAAFEMAKHALDLTRELKADDQEPVDLYHCGVFAVMAKKSAEGLDFLNAARAACEKAGDQMLLPEVLINIGQVKGLTGDHEGGRAALEQALALVRARGDRGRELRVLEHLGVLLSTAGDHAAAADRFKDAAEKALGPEAKEYRKNLRKRMQEEQQRAKGLG